MYAMQPSILSPDGGYPFIIVHALTWVCSFIFGMVVFLNVDKSTSPPLNSESKAIALVNFILPIIIAGAAVAHAMCITYERGKSVQIVFTALMIGTVDLALVFSAATLFMSALVADTYILAAFSSLFTAAGSGMVKVFYNIAHSNRDLERGPPSGKT
jgi:hypothetical protein